MLLRQFNNRVALSSCNRLGLFIKRWFEMKMIKVLLVIAAVSVSSLAMAEGGSDRIFDRAHAANKAAMQAYCDASL